MRWRDGKSEHIEVSIVFDSEIYTKICANAGLFRKRFAREDWVWETNLHKAGRIRLIAWWKLERCRCRRSDKSDLARGLDANERANGQCKGMKKADGAVCGLIV